MGAVNYITTVIRLRAPGMTWFRMPLTVWGLFLTSILNALFVPVLGARRMVLLFLDRVFGTQFFIAGSTIKGGGDPILYQHLFWLFGHPEVYILILPAWGIVSDLLSFFARKPAFGYRVTRRGRSSRRACCRALVYGHHMFTTGMSPLLGESFMVLTMIISVPAVAALPQLAGHAVAGRHAPRPRRCCSALGLVFTFGVGGLTGLYLGRHRRGHVPARHLLRRRALPPDHGGGGAAGVVRGDLLLVPEDVRAHDERAAGQAALLARRSSRSTSCSAASSSSGTPGMQRRLYDPSVYEFLRHLLPLNKLHLARRRSCWARRSCSSS